MESCIKTLQKEADDEKLERRGNDHGLTMMLAAQTDTQAIFQRA